MKIDMQRPIVGETSRRFAVMSFVCAVLIVVLHTFAGRLDCPIERIAGNMIQDGICRIAIPWFFLAAGFFLAGHMTENGWWQREVLKRVRSLLVPFWIWSLVIFAVYLFFAVAIKLAHYEYHGPQAFDWLSFDGLMMLLGVHPWKTMPTMWFLRTLFVFVLLSPVIYAIRNYAVYIFFVTYVVMSYLDIEIPSVFELRGVFYFSLGIRARLRPFRVPRTNICLFIGGGH